ncbi:hypothetical protein Cgig2_009074 [Carnegiea gigantea]|uniref:Uncharacterized protein n=1 Tax=Carnegiea gigantea TaxID=171969 RepID=A0A9Q1KEG2_9CARY|nr:hypothetical protein Cgig2_009074 [Carnegiea gigantea]
MSASICIAQLQVFVCKLKTRKLLTDRERENDEYWVNSDTLSNRIPTNFNLFLSPPLGLRLLLQGPISLAFAAAAPPVLRALYIMPNGNDLFTLHRKRMKLLVRGHLSVVLGESDNRTVLDAFFLGKALGEALTEQIESAVGELLSTIGRLQAEQQKQIQDFQEDVLERAKRAKEKAAREALQEQGRLIPPSTTANEPVANGSSASPPSHGSATPAAPASVDNQNSRPSSSNEGRTGYVTRTQVDE